MKKVVLKVEVLDEKIKQKAMKAISGLEGLESIEMNMKDRKLTVMGDIDPVTVASKLKKLCHTEILTVGPAKEEKKKEEPKKDEPKKDNTPPKIAYPIPCCYYDPPPNTCYYRPVVVEEYPNDRCVIC